MSELNLPGRIGVFDKRSLSFHVLCDASQLAYSTIFLRCEEENEIYVQFVIAKARVASLKRAIPRLQLLPCVLGSRLSQYFVKEKSPRNSDFLSAL